MVYNDKFITFTCVTGQFTRHIFQCMVNNTEKQEYFYTGLFLVTAGCSSNNWRITVYKTFPGLTEPDNYMYEYLITSHLPDEDWVIYSAPVKSVSRHK